MNNNQYTFTYEKYWKDYKQLLSLFTKWINLYYNGNNLSRIKASDIDIADSRITNLKFNCLGINTQYIEEIDIWYNEFLEL